MSNYSNNPEMVRVDFFKASGKWYATEEMEWQNYTGCIQEAFKASLWKAFTQRYAGMTAVCLEPYHEHAFPLMMKDWW